MAQAITQARIKISGFSLTRPRLSPMLVVIVLMSLLSLLFVWTRIHAISLEYEISRLERDLRIQTQQVKVLSLEVAFLSRDERIESMARNELGLRDPAPGQIVRVE